MTGGVYRPSEPPAPVVITCVWCGKAITPKQRRQRIGLGTLHDEPETPCVAEFDDLAYGSRRVR